MLRPYRKLLIALGVILAILIVVPLLIPSDGIRRAAEDAASGASGMQVRIDSLGFRLLPSPGLSIRRVTVSDVKNGTPRLAVASASRFD